ncbi:MAG TPA: hypothetical protein VFV35_00970 [Acidimicrobiales bacterium]|nr:hypothetical protein [Acidimicrobiales bacterium]
MDFVLLLVTILLVLIAAVTLLIGIFGDNLALIFVSIGASAAAAVVLAVLSQISRRTSREEEGRSQAAGLEPATLAPAGQLGGAAAPEPAEAAVPEPAPAAPTTAVTTAVSAPTAAVAAADLPIAGYDQLRVAEILPRLDDLDLDELEEVAQHEETTKNRATILNRIDELMDQLEAVEPTAAPALSEAPAADVDVTPADAAPGLPIADYDALDGDEVIPLLADLDAEALEAVAEYEETHANRDRVLDAIDDRLDELEGIGAAAAPVPTPVTPAVGPLPARKAASKKAAVRQTAITKAARPRATAKKAVAKTATAKKATVKKATAKKTSAVAAATKAVAKKAPTAAKRSSSGPVAKRTAAATKAVKMAKKATKATKASKRS